VTYEASCKNLRTLYMVISAVGEEEIMMIGVAFSVLIVSICFLEHLTTPCYHLLDLRKAALASIQIFISILRHITRLMDVDRPSCTYQVW
jgi:hypothetical protein